jgi:DNA-binding transcriptional LysR family regulator
MTVETAKLFCDLVEIRSFTRAAQLHGLTESAVSQRISALERELKTVLIVRKRKRLQLTPEGEICHRHCLEIVRLAAEMVKRLEQAAHTTAARFELAACYSIGLHQLPPVLKQFRLDYPKAEVCVRYNLIDRVHEQVMDDAVDLGLVCYPRHQLGLVIDPFRHERLMLVCHPQHPLAAQPVFALRDLRGQRIVAWQEIRRSHLYKRVPTNERHHYEPVHDFTDVEMVKRMVEMDEGVAILPETIVLPEVAGHRLAAVPFEDGGCTEPLAVIYKKTKRLTPAMKHFINALKQPAPGEIPSLAGAGEGGAAG